MDPHNHFYDNAFDILNADELSILRDGDTASDGDGRRSQLPAVDHFYDEDEDEDDNAGAGGEDLTTTVDWQEVENSKKVVKGGDSSQDTEQHHSHHSATKNCMHTSKFCVLHTIAWMRL